MFNKFKKAVFVLVFGCIGALASEGVEYTKLDSAATIPNADNKIIEIFSYSCIHCYRHHKYTTLKNVSEYIPNMHYELWQVDGMGSFSREMIEVLGFAKMFDEKNGIKNELNDNSVFQKVLSAYFKANFEQKRKFISSDDFYALAANVIGKATQETITISDIKTYASSQAAKDYINSISKAINIAQISGTPSFVIKGKYLINLEKIDSEEKLVEVIREILNNK